MDKELENSGDSFFRDREDSFDTPEEQVVHFMSRAGRPGWKWMSVSCGGKSCSKFGKLTFHLVLLQLRARSPQPHHSHSGSQNQGHYHQQPPPSQNSRKAEPYYCDRTLFQSLVRDAMVTETFGQENVKSTGKKEDKQ